MTKISRVDPNLANELRERVLARFPELAENPPSGLWFVGSNIWTASLHEPTPDGADWDLVCTRIPAGHYILVGERPHVDSGLPVPRLVKDPSTADVRSEVVRMLGLAAFTSISTSRKRHHDHSDRYASEDGWGAGICYETDRGQVDVWESADGTILGALRAFPRESHDHCRVAFSLTDGVVLLPNDTATRFWAKATISEPARGFGYPPATPMPGTPFYTTNVPGNEPLEIPVADDDEPNPFERRRGRAVGAWLLLAFLALTMLAALLTGGCVTAPLYPAPVLGRTTAEQHASAVKISRVCYDAAGTGWYSTGSGSVIDSDSVLTARHVVAACDTGHGALQVITSDGAAPITATVVWSDDEHDLAELVVPGVEPTGGAAVLAHVDVGSAVCAEPAHPEARRACGRVVSRDDHAAVNGTLDIEVTTPAIPGNSGAGVYDEFGRLVGVVTNSIPCALVRDQACGGLASSVIGRLP